MLDCEHINVRSPRTECPARGRYGQGVSDFPTWPAHFTMYVLRRLLMAILIAAGLTAPAKAESMSRVVSIIAETTSGSANSFNAPAYDGRKLAQAGGNFKLQSESDAQTGAAGLWEAYFWEILVILVIIPLQGILVAWFVYEQRARRAAERESHQHLMEAAKMDRAMMVSAMSASIAHELNQPLGAILGNAEAAEILLAADSPNPKELKEIIADIRRDDQRAADIIRRLRALLIHSDLEAKEANLTDVIGETIRLIHHLASAHNVTINAVPFPEGLRVGIDPIHLEQVLLNITMNGIEAMQDIPVGARELNIGVDQRGGEVRVSIRDTGRGIPREKLHDIFEPFVTTKGKGMGLGLSIAKTLIATYGGRIWAENAPAGGAVFQFTLRLVTAHAEAK